jgi:DNA-binding GntR family transcriptional regulator
MAKHQNEPISQEKIPDAGGAAGRQATGASGAFLNDLQIGKDARTLGANVTNAIRTAIIQGKLAPGEPLGQEYLANLFGVSRVPIRECLKQLASEGLVEVEPHKGAVVARLSLDELDELYGIIWSLETLAVRIGVPQLTDDDIASMAKIVAQMDRVDEPLDWYRTSVAFHRTILVASGWQRCIRIVDECRKNIGRYIMEVDFFSEHVGQWRERNRTLFEACKRRDVEAAVGALDVMRRISTAQIRDHLKLVLDGESEPRRTLRE